MSDNDNVFDNDDVFDNASAIVPSVDSQLAEARKLISAGDNDKAMPIVREVLRQDKSNASGLWLYANLIRTEDTTKAITALKRLLAVEPTHTKAKAMLDKLEDDDLFNDDSPALQRKAKVSSGIPEGINIVVNTQNTAQAQAAPVYMPMGPMQQRNGTAFVAGLIGGWVFGFFGIAHLFNGKIGAGLGYILLSFVWGGIAFGIAAASAGVCLLGIIPLHFFMVWKNAGAGAQQIVYPQMAGGMTARM
jgi:hypothetical protein